MSAPDYTDPRWRKSSRSNGAGECVEVAMTSEATYVRDSKLGSRSPVIDVSAEGWKHFLDGIESGQIAR